MSRYRDFIDAGGLDAEWEAYQESQNALRKAAGKLGILTKWANGYEVQGMSIMHLFNDACIATEPALKSILQDENTLVSTSSITAKGLTRKVAKHWHEVVCERMGYVIFPENEK